MKLSRRGKHTKHARRGKHTKRAGKHHTRHIKHHIKKYKRTYRKNNRKLKHNKRIQKGGVTWENNEKTWTAKDISLKYKKLSQMFGNGETKPFNITLELSKNKDSIGLNYRPDYNFNMKIFYGRFNLKMERLNDKGIVEKTFIVYFAVYGISKTVRYTDGRVKDVIHPVVVYSSDENFSTRSIIDEDYLPCYGLTGITDSNKEKYDFSCGTYGDKEFTGNRDFFISLKNKMYAIVKPDDNDNDNPI